MLYFSSIEVYLAIFGWAMFNIIWTILEVTSLWIAPIGLMIFKIFREARETDDARPPATVAMWRIVFYMVVTMIMIMLFLKPAVRLEPTTVGYIQKASLLNAGAPAGTVVSFDQDDNLYKTGYGDVAVSLMNDADVRVPLGWFVFNNILASGVQAGIEQIPEPLDLLGAISLLSQGGGLPQAVVPQDTENEGLLQMASVAEQCHTAGQARARDLLNRDIPDDARAILVSYVTGGLRADDIVACVYDDSGCGGLTNANGEPYYARGVTVPVRYQGVFDNALTGDETALDCNEVSFEYFQAIQDAITAESPIGEQVITALEEQGFTVQDKNADDNYDYVVAAGDYLKGVSGVLIDSASPQDNVAATGGGFAVNGINPSQTMIGAALGNLNLDNFRDWPLISLFTNVSTEISALKESLYITVLLPILPILKGILLMMFIMFIPIIMFLTSYKASGVGALLGFYFVMVFVELMWAVSAVVENQLLGAFFTNGNLIDLSGLSLTQQGAIDDLVEILGYNLRIFAPVGLMLLVSLAGMRAVSAASTQMQSRVLADTKTSAASTNAGSNSVSAAGTVATRGASRAMKS